MAQSRAVALLLSAFLASTLAAQSFEFDPAEPIVDLPLVYLSNGNYPGLPCIEVTLAGAPRLFLLDTGFNGVGVAPDLAHELEFEQRGSDLQAGIGGFQAVPLYRVPELEIGRARFSAPLFYGLQTRGFDQGRARKLAGILGGQLFAKCVVTIDYPAGRVRLIAPEAFTPPADVEPQRLDFGIGQPEVWATIDGGRRVRFALDTGAEGGLILNPPFVERQGFAAAPDRLPAVNIVGFNGAVKSHTCSLGEFAFAGRTFADATALLLGSIDGFSMGNDSRRGGLIGSAMLANLRVTFDYAHRHVYLEGPADAAPAHPSGISADWDDAAAVTIVEVASWPDREAVDLVRGDRLVLVDGAPPAGPLAFRALLRDKAEVVLTVERDGARHQVTWRRIARMPPVAAAAK